MTITEMGCCGAYCGSCRALREHTCKGCRIGYDSRERDISRARCRIKVCCITKAYNSCADCPDILACRIINGFYGRKGHKYSKYKQAIEFIRQNGYEEFIRIADTWTNAHGRYK